MPGSASSPVAVTAKSPTVTTTPGPVTGTEVSVLPAEHWTEAPDDDYDNDGDSAVGADVQSSTASISSSILKYRTLRGRTYHSEQSGQALYWGSNDGQHSLSLDIMYHALNLCMEDEAYLAPVKNPKKVLDIGTGTGIWAIDFADEHPEAVVIGTDISPIQPAWVPPNVSFEIEDFTQPWTFPPSSVDYVYMRCLIGSVANWYALFREAYAVLEPGGYFETYEVSAQMLSDDGSLPDDAAIAQWGPIFFQGGDKMGHTCRVVEENLQVKAMEAAGFVDINVRKVKCPSGIWPKDPRQREIGEMVMYSILNDVEGWILFMSNFLGWTNEQIKAYNAHLRYELKKGEYHGYFWHNVVYGRKPAAGEF